MSQSPDHGQDNSSLYNSLYRNWKMAYPFMSSNDVRKRVGTFWRLHKNTNKEAIEMKILQLQNRNLEEDLHADEVAYMGAFERAGTKRQMTLDMMWSKKSDSETTSKKIKTLDQSDQKVLDEKSATIEADKLFSVQTIDTINTTTECGTLLDPDIDIISVVFHATEAKVKDVKTTETKRKGVVNDTFHSVDSLISTDTAVSVEKEDVIMHSIKHGSETSINSFPPQLTTTSEKEFENASNLSHDEIKNKISESALQPGEMVETFIVVLPFTPQSENLAEHCDTLAEVVTEVIDALEVSVVVKLEPDFVKESLVPKEQVNAGESITTISETEVLNFVTIRKLETLQEPDDED